MEAVCTDVNNVLLVVQENNFEETFLFSKKNNFKRNICRLFNNKLAQIWFHLKDVEFCDFLKFSVDHFDLEVSLHTGIPENL